MQNVKCKKKNYQENNHCDPLIYFRFRALLYLRKYQRK